MRELQPPRVIAGIVSGLVGAVFAVLLAAFTYVRFPREVVLYRSRPAAPVQVFRSDFEAAPGPAGNLWTLEIELAGDLKPGQAFTLALNETPLATLAADKRRWTIEFPGSALRAGKNSFRVDSAQPWVCRSFRILNVSGYASGLVAAVVFPKTNSYPGVPGRPSSAVAWMLALILGCGIFLLDFVSGRKPSRPPKIFGVLRAIRFTVPALCLVIPAAPLVSRYKVLVEPRSVLVLITIYIGLAFGREVWTFLARAGRFLEPLGTALVTAVRGVSSRVPFLRTWDRALSSALLAAFVLVALFWPGPNQIRGDGVEYYAMTVSLARFQTPYLTPESCAFASKLLGPLPWAPDEPLFDWLKSNVGALVKNGREIDLTHFWFYPLLAAIFFWPLRLLSLGPQYGFILLHLALVFIAFAVVRKKLGPLAGVSLLLIALGSPLPWFITRPQVEFFTAFLAVVGVACLVAEDYLSSAVAFALASTQNPPFAILAGLVFVFGFARKRWGPLLRSFPLWAGAGLLCLINPAYFYFRHGFLNPVVAAGGASLGHNSYAGKKMLSLFIDPDIGLFPNWPLALLLLVILLALAVRKKAGLSPRMWIFLGLSTFVLLWSQARTLNFNHGGTYHISRYALWYMPLIFLALWRALAAAAAFKAPVRRAMIAAALILGLVQGIEYRPTRPETYLEQTRLSRFVYERLPWLFNPVPEVFIERQIGKEETPPKGVWAVSTPSGNKILIWEDRLVHLSEDALPPISTAPDLDPILVYREAVRRTGGERNEVVFYINGLGAAFRRPRSLF